MPTTDPRTATVLPHDLAAEESVIGSCLISDRAIATSRDILRPADFYREGLGSIFNVCTTMQDRGDPVDVVTLRAELDRLGILDDVGGQSRVYELGNLMPAASNVAHYARIVAEQARNRQAWQLGERLTAAAANGGIEKHPDILTQLQQLLDDPAGVSDLRPLWWQQAMNEEIPETTEYVEDVLQTGVLADIVGLPYLHKTAIALELAVKIARGSGRFLGRHEILTQAPVAYFWADDSRAKELERIQAYGERHEIASLPLAFYLNPGISLLDDLAAVKAEIREHGYRVVFFDSLYNFAAGVDWSKDHAAVTALYSNLKRLCDQIEGLTTILIDHAAKPSEANRDRLSGHSSFGSVFKAASVRCTIAVEKEKGGKLYLSATGNNIRGFPRAPAFWAEHELEVRLVEDVETTEEKIEELRDLVLEWVREHPGRSTTKVSKGVRRRPADVSATLRALELEGLLVDDLGTASQLLGKRSEAVSPDAIDAYSEPLPDSTGKGGKRSAWRALDPSVQAAQPLPEIPGSGSEAVTDSAGGSVRHEPLPEPFPPVGGKGGRRPQDDPEHEDRDAPDWLEEADQHLDELERQAEDAEHERGADHADDIDFSR